MANKRLYESGAVWDQRLQVGQRNIIQAICDFWPEGIRTALDVGCGDGKITRALAERTDVAFHGFDGSREALSRLGLPATRGDVSKLPFDDRAFDLVLTTDVFEHLSDDTERAAWCEIFRVARDWVIFVVPFREELLDATTVCGGCGHRYHVNWHQRAYDFSDISECTPEGWTLAGTILSGEPWSSMLPPETAYRRSAMDEWAGWSESVCPACSARGSVAAPIAPLSAEVARALGQYTYQHVSKRRFLRSHSEVIALFCRSGSSLITSRAVPPHHKAMSASRWVSRMGVGDNLDPYPQTAKMVSAVGGGFAVQFPVYPGHQPRLEFLGRDRGGVNLVIEDGWGVLFQGEIQLAPNSLTELVLPREINAGYYGLLVRTSSCELVQSVSLLGSAPIVIHLFPGEGQTAYYRVPDTSIFVQAMRPTWIDVRSLTSEHNEYAEAVNAAVGALTCAEMLTCTQIACLNDMADQRDEFSSRLSEISGIRDGLITQTLQYENELVELKKRLAELTSTTHASEQNKTNTLGKNNGESSTTVLMLCHDQHLDRRVVAQAQSLISIGCRVILVALSFDSDGSEEKTPEGIDLVRIGLAKITPENPIYRGYVRRQNKFNACLNSAANHSPAFRAVFSAGFRLASKSNWLIYKLMLLLAYRNRTLHDPLPFRSAFVNAASHIEADIIQVHDLPALEAGVELAQMRNAPLVYDAHELYPEQASFSSVQKKICSAAELKLIKHADLVFAVNESIAREMSNRYSIGLPRVLLNAIDPLPTFDPSLKYDLLREKTGVGTDKRILLFQGGFAPNRNLENLVCAFRWVTTPDVDLVLMGFGSFGEKLKALAQKYGLLNRRVHFIAAVSQAELLQHSASADMGIIPYPHVDLNSYYCTPNKLFEFIQAGLPILANRSPELERFVKANGFGDVASMNSAEQIASAIDQAFASGEMSSWRQALLDGQQRFTWKVEEQCYLSVMRGMLNECDRRKRDSLATR